MNENDSLKRLDIQAREHEAWVDWAEMMRDLGFDLNTVSVVDFEPARVALCKWALIFTEGHEAGVFTTLKEEA